MPPAEPPLVQLDRMPTHGDAAWTVGKPPRAWRDAASSGFRPCFDPRFGAWAASLAPLRRMADSASHDAQGTAR